jgi:hypothetical protein
MWLIASALLVASGPGPAVQFLQGIYQHYVGSGKGVSLDTDADVKRWFAPELAQLILDDRAAAEKRGGEVPNLDWDPFMNGQDWSVARFRVTVKGTSAVVKLIEPKGAVSEVKLELQETEAGWRVADVYQSSGESLKKYLKKSLENPP